MLSRSRSVHSALERQCRRKVCAFPSLSLTGDGSRNKNQSSVVTARSDLALATYGQRCEFSTTVAFADGFHVHSRNLYQSGARMNDNHRVSFPMHMFSTNAIDDDVTVENVVEVDNSHASSNDSNEKQGSTLPTFASLDQLDPALKTALANAGLVHMTPVQYETFEAGLKGADVLARARTGTGKTLAFLLPAIQRLILEKRNPSKEKLARGIDMLILSPTRELASQIYEQAKMLTNHLNSSGDISMSSQVVYGGTSRDADITYFARRNPNILVATPGRLIDHIENSQVGNRRFADFFQSTSVLVLDETDRMLDMGFKLEVETIMRYLPKERQTLLFSATVPDSLRSVMAATMRAGFETVDCIGQDSNDEDGQHTNSQVIQAHVVLTDGVTADSNGTPRMVTGVVEILYNLIQSQPPVKMIVFFPTSQLTSFYSALFNNGLKIPVMELHARKTQAARTATSKRFRSHPSGILFTTDVSARGVDYPDVTHVVQIGMPESRESYIHRLGRTGRAGKVGTGLLILTETEKAFLDQLDGIDVPADATLQAQMDAPPSSDVMDRLAPLMKSIGSAPYSDLSSAAQKAYRSLLGFYKSKFPLLGYRGTNTLVDFCNQFALQVGMSKPPSLREKLANSMGLRRAQGLNIVPDFPGDGMGGGGGGGGRNYKAPDRLGFGNQYQRPPSNFGRQSNRSQDHSSFGSVGRQSFGNHDSFATPGGYGMRGGSGHGQRRPSRDGLHHSNNNNNNRNGRFGNDDDDDDPY